MRYKPLRDWSISARRSLDGRTESVAAAPAVKCCPKFLRSVGYSTLFVLCVERVLRLEPTGDQIRRAI